ncbi:helicase associated domain-containing protein [Phocaeicola sp.]|uniref:helicase associated domain-containing protein n=1 Tax=Phocaeicola sp. TaxID=2773926 RepID=UPI00307BC473
MDFESEDGICKRNAFPRPNLPSGKIGIYWGNRNDRQWNEVYGAAKRYFEVNGDLDVPVAYVSPEGYALGKWVRRQQYAYRNPEKSNAILSQERIELLDAIGMQWEKPDPW